MNHKKALVTGASEGIGRAFVKRLINEGYQVTGVARSEGRLQELKKELRDEKGGADGFSFLIHDLSSHHGIQELSRHLHSHNYHLLVNNAGMGIYGIFHETSLDKLQEMTRLNCDAIVALSHAFLSRARKGDALINVSSILAFLPMPISGLYAATKAFVTSFTDTLWLENRKRGVYVVGLCPGVTRTQFNDRAGGVETKIPDFITQTPDQVVQVALQALEARKVPGIVSGWINRAMVFCYRVFPRSWIVVVMGRTRNVT